MSKLIILLCLVALAVPAFGQSAMVRRVTAETEDGVLFSAWVVRQRVKYGQDIEVNYRVENRGRRAVYMVLEEPARAEVSDGKLVIFAAYLSNEHDSGGSEFRLIRVGRGATHSGRLIISKSVYKVQDIWPIGVGLSILREAGGFGRRVADPTEQRALSSKARIVSLGGLIVDVD